PFSKRQLFGAFSRHMDRVIANSSLPYDRTRPKPAVPGDPVSQMLAPIYTHADFKPTLDRTENSLLEGSLALRAYRLEHGHYPARLDEMVPEILKRVPTDPFAAGQPLRYHRSDGACILYSVGPDGKDDGGVSSTRPAPTYSGRTRIQEEGRGDIVAGIDQS
ncbi:MAG: hypothetical protein LC772_04910, partial [Chloroflexi bacterium]|nr:hypothetical protein [Chloroflexota bacterium]